MHLFYTPNIAVENILPEEESQHAVRVLRLQAGDEIVAVDGMGGWYNAVITNPHPKKCSFEIKKAVLDYEKRSYKLHMAIAPTKNIERFEWFLEKATEIGVDEITPLICQFSERKMIKPERLEKIIVSASKQSLKAFFPVLNPMCTFNEFLKKYTAQQQFIAHCYDDDDKKTLQSSYMKSSEAIILIGPEGDFSQEEVKTAKAKQYSAVSLGNSRLRTETAGIAAVHTVSLLNDI